MARFVPLSHFKELYDEQASLLTKEGHHRFLERISKQTADRYNISEEDFSWFRKAIQNPANILFYSWIEGTNSISEFLSNNTLAKYDDNQGILKHRLAEDFKVFVSPILSEAMLKYQQSGELKELLTLFSFVQLLDEDHRATVESHLFKPIETLLKSLKADAKSKESESELASLIEPLALDEVIQIINHLSKASYSTKLNYVDSLLGSLKAKSCTPRLANWVLKRLELLTLNAEHEYKINDLKQELKRGELQVKNVGSGRIPIRGKTVLIVSFLALLSVCVIYVILYKPFSVVQPVENPNETAFTQFSKEERMKIDSLLKEMKGNKIEDDIAYDPSVPIIGGGPTLVLRNPFKNNKMEAIYQDLAKNATLYENGLMNPCGTEVSYSNLPNVKELTQRSGDIRAMFRNESDYDIILYVGERSQSGEVYGMYIKNGETKVFEMGMNNTLLIVPGNHFQAFTVPQGVKADELPSQNYVHHFCEIDYNFSDAIHIPYRVVKSVNGKAKFLVDGDIGDNIQLVDVHGVLEEY